MATNPESPDPRLHRYREAVQAMQTGRFDVTLAPHHEDAVGRLGMELEELARGLDRRFREQASLQALSEHVEASFFLPDVLDAVYDGFRELIPYDRIGCALVDREGPPEEWSVVARWARTDEGEGEVEIGPGYEQPLAGSSLEEVLETGRPRILNDLTAYLEEKPESDSTRRMVAEGIRSSLTCPLLAHGMPVGFLFFSSREPGTYRDIHTDIFLRIAQQLSLVVEKSLLLERLFELTRDLREAHAELEHRAAHDPLTGLLNRSAVQARLREEVDRALRQGGSVGAILLDVDRFKSINDRYGHHAGDAVLRHIARALDDASRSFETVGRWGGEEFLVVLAGASEEGTRRAAARLRARVAETVAEYEGERIRATVSAGCSAGTPSEEAFADALARAADGALYQAKEAGRNRVAYAPPGERRHRTELEGETL